MIARLLILLIPALFFGCKRSVPAPIQAPEPTPAAAVPGVDGVMEWKPLRVGAGGFVTGFVSHPLDANVRYCRTDVGNAYRWDGKEWIPMLVEGGLPKELTAVPGNNGVDSIAVDPRDKDIVYMAFRVNRSKDVEATHPRLPGNVYKSVDGGRTFAAGDLSLYMEPNGPARAEGERLMVDPGNGETVFYASHKNGLWRSRDGGKTWRGVDGEGAPAADAHVVNVWVHGDSGFVYAIEPQGEVRRSSDGGETWQVISAGNAFSGNIKTSFLDHEGTLYVAQRGSRTLWRWRDGAWASMNTGLPQNLQGVTVDSRDRNQIWVIAGDSSVGRSTDGGATWKNLGPMNYANTFSWLPQPAGWRSNGGIKMDREGTLWVPQGNEGMVRWRPNDAAPLWTIDSAGIEELVTHDVIMPPGGPIVVAVHDATGMVIENPDIFSARQIPMQDQLISNGTSISYCPNDPAYFVIPSADVNWTNRRPGGNFSGFSLDGGKTWQRFAGLPVDEKGEPIRQAGRIAVSRRGDWKAGEDHLVWLPSGKFPTYYSHDGGKTWQPSEGFPLGDGFWNFSLKRRTLQADPFQPDLFYFAGSWGGGFYVSRDGGKSWIKNERAGLPRFLHHAQLATNPKREGELWFVSGWEGSSEKGMWLSRDGGDTFQRVPGVEHAITLALGMGTGQTGDADYTVYFYGKRAESSDWRLFRSTDAGTTWTVVSGLPGGILDQPTCMAASWDRFSEIVVGYVGNSFVIGRIAP